MSRAKKIFPVAALVLILFIGSYGYAAQNGLKYTTRDTVYMLSLNPQTGLLITYPNPNTVGDKIIINKKTNTLYYYQQGELARTYSVATGKEEQFTPEGTFKIVTKTLYPNGDDPDSILGVRWMGLGVPFEKDKRAKNDLRAPSGLKYGIHGTNEPESIGKHASGGCIRMRNEDVVELYEIIPIGTEVEIR